MPSFQTPQLVAIGSAVVGFIFLITSALLLDTYAPTYEDFACSSTHNPFFQAACETLRYVIAAGSIGIIVSLIQMGAVSLGFMKKWRMWCILQIVIALGSLIAFSIAIDKEVHKAVGSNADGRGKAFCAFAGIDLFFSLFAAAGVFYLTKE